MGRQPPVRNLTIAQSCPVRKFIIERSHYAYCYALRKFANPENRFVFIQSCLLVVKCSLPAMSMSTDSIQSASASHHRPMKRDYPVQNQSTAGIIDQSVVACGEADKRSYIYGE